ncbi:MAG: DNA repair exonuclease [Nanoarchaeota archaeon]|nr:DNA repair exonuclease [Nanoarchaeota archaeon]
MKIAIFSDTHCGFKYGEERGEDSFIALEEALAKSMDCDLILNAGDMFDTRIPRPEVFARTAKILSRIQSIPSQTKFVNSIGKNIEDISPSAVRGIPMVAIHGTHERRSTTMINPVHSLEHSGLLIHLERGAVVFDINGEKVAIHGMSGVSEKYAKEALDEWNPQPVEGATNILLFHQSVNPYIYSPLDPPTVDITDLPKGFDLYVLGHMHWTEVRDLHGGKLLLAGSTIPTSIHAKEATGGKYIFKYDGKNIERVRLENQRKVIIEELEFDAGIKDKIVNILTSIPSQSPKPIVVVKINGQLPKDVPPPNFRDVEERFKDKFILYINKKLEVQDFEDQIEIFKRLRDNRMSPEEHGLKILNESLKQLGGTIKTDDIFDLLVEGNSDLIFDILTGKQKTLVNI